MPGATYFVTWKCQPGETLSPAERAISLDALLHFHGERAAVYAANVMSNHAHWIVRPYTDVELDDLTTSIKRFSAIAINKHRGVKGHLWDPECFDHIIRDSGFFRKFLAYVIDNPVEAGVASTPAEYEWTFVSGTVLGRFDDISAHRATQDPATECRGTRTEALS
jgi:REP element-mobilizing transposase RayT